MFTLALRCDFEAWHHLIGGNWGEENKPHSHLYRLELQLHGKKLDRHGYLVDLVEVGNHLDRVLSKYRGADLNTLPEFANLNPSLEHFARILCSQLSENLSGANLSAVIVRLWESDEAWASFRLDF